MAYVGCLWLTIDLDKPRREHKKEKYRIRRQQYGRDGRDGRQKDSYASEENLNRKSDNV